MAGREGLWGPEAFRRSLGIPPHMGEVTLPESGGPEGCSPPTLGLHLTLSSEQPADPRPPSVPLQRQGPSLRVTLNAEGAMRLEMISEQKPTGLATPRTPLGCLPTHSARVLLLLPAALVSVSRPRLFAQAQLSVPPQVRLATSTPSLHPYPALSELSAARTLTRPNAVSARPLPQTPVSSGVGHVSALGGEPFSPKLPSIPSPDPCPPAPFPSTCSHHGQLVKVTLAVLGHCCHWLGQDLIRKREAGPQRPVPHLPAGLGASDSTSPR